MIEHIQKILEQQLWFCWWERWVMVMVEFMDGKVLVRKFLIVIILIIIVIILFNHNTSVQQ